MKHFFLIVALLLIGARQTMAQELLLPPPSMPYDETSKLLIYTKVFELAGLGTGEILNLGRRYYIERLKGRVSDISLDDRENGDLLYKVYQPYSPPGFLSGPSTITYDIEMRAKDGRAKLIVTPRRLVELIGPGGDVASDLPIPFTKQRGLFAKSDKTLQQWYGDMDGLVNEFMRRYVAYMQDEAVKFKKNKDF